MINSSRAMTTDRSPAPIRSAQPDHGKTDDERAKEIMTIKEVMSEIQTLRKLNHPSILNLKEYYVTEAENHVYVITEVLYGGAVLDAILKMKDERYTEAEAKVVVRQTLEGIDYMHSHLVIHRDLKLENLLLKQQDDLSSVVIADFGLAKRCREKTTSSTRLVKDGEYLPHAKGVDDSAVGTPVYAAPEVVEQKSYGAAVDMWSLGVIVYILVTGAMPRDLWKAALKYGKVTKEDFGFDCYEWDDVSAHARDFVVKTLVYNPKNRMSARDALNHPWMKHVTNVRPAPLRIKSKLRDFAKGMKLPLRRYAPGEYLIKQGERASDEVFLIKSGKVDIIVHDRETGEPVKVATREVGEFVGEIAAATALLEKSPSGKGKGPEDAAAAGPRKSISEPDKEFLEGGRAKSTFAGAISARIAGKKWVGQRRTADVVAATKVECLVLGKKEMQWAITHDEAIKSELEKDIRRRRMQTQMTLSKSIKHRDVVPEVN